MMFSMSNRYPMQIVILGFFVGVTGLAAGEEWRVSDVVKATLATHPSLDASREKLRESESERSKASSVLFPSVDATLTAATRQDALTGNPTFNGEVYNFYNLGISVTQPIYAGGALLAGRKLYDRSVHLNKIDVGLTERDLTLKALKAFYHVLLSERRMATQIRLQKIQSELLNTAQSRYRIGNEQALTVLQMKTNLLLLEPQVTAAQNQLRVAAAELASLTGKPNLVSMKLNGTLEAPGWEEVAGRVPKENFERAELAKNLTAIEVAEARGDVSLAAHKPSLFASGTWGRGGTQKSDLTDNDASNWSVGLQLKVPLFSGLSSLHDRSIAASSVAQSRISERANRDQFALEQVRAEQELANAKSQVSSSTKALMKANEAVDVAARTYRLGTATYTQVSEAQRNLTNAEIAFEQAQFDQIEKMANYFVAFGWPLSPLIESLEAKWSAVQTPVQNSAVESAKNTNKKNVNTKKSR
jgi:outer membrane protein